MERDFLGLNSSKARLVSVKEAFVDGPKDSGFTQSGTGKDWPYINMNKLPRHYLSFNTSQEDKNKRAPVTDSCHPNKRSTSDLQKTFNHHRPAAANFPMAAYNAHPEAHNNSQRQQSFLATNIPHSMNNPFFKTHFAGLATQNSGGAAAKQPVVGAVPVAASHPPFLSAGSIAGFTEKWNNVKASGPPAKLTIFYGGTVNVFDEISPEKAQAIFFLAGTGCSMASNPNSQGSYLQTQPANGGATVNQNTKNASNSAISSPISVSSHTGSNNEMLQAHKLTGVLITPIHKTDTSSIRPSMSASMRQSDVPQARKASLARFLEKRKGRVMTAAAPYDLFKRSSEFIP